MPFDGKLLEANSPVVTLLHEARGRIEKGWTTLRLKRTDGGGPPKYCALGAIINSSYWDSIKITPEMKEAVTYVWKAVGEPPLLGEIIPHAAGVADYNNNHSQQDVLGAFDKAIELATADALVTA